MYTDKISKKNAVVCSLGNVFVWYNYSLFMPFLVVLLSEFFQDADSHVKMLSGFFVFSLGLFSRPVGAYIFGRLGDRISRERSLGVSIYLMAFATVGVALLPSYNDIGIYSTIFLAILRCLQGIAMGGASSVSIVHLVELFPKNRKCLGGAIAQSGMLLGIVLSSSMLALSCVFSEFIPKTIFCRFAFSLGILLVPFARFNLNVKTRLDSQNKLTKSVLQKLWLRFLATTLLTIFPASCFYVLFAFLPNYIEIRYPNTLENILVLVNLFTLCTILVSGHLSDKIKKLYTLLIGIAIAVISAFCILFISSELPKLLFLMGGLSLAVGIFYGAGPTFFSELFPKDSRCTGMAVSMSISQATFGGLIPIVLTKLAAVNINMIVLPIFFAASIALVILIVYVKYISKNDRI